MVFAMIPDMPPAIKSRAKLSLIGTGAFGLANVGCASCALLFPVVWVTDGFTLLLVAVMAILESLKGDVQFL